MTGHAWIAGAGPGDPGLLTVAAREALARADVVLYDALVDPRIVDYAPPGAERIYVGKRAGEHALPQAKIEELIVEHARAGKRVVRLKGGDPFIFGRGGEEALACRAAGVAYTIIPGITSAIAAPAYAGIPVTHRGLAANFLVLTGNEPGEEQSPVDWAAAARADTVVILMGAATLAANMQALAAAGRDPATPVACIRWGTRPDQLVVTGTLATIAERAQEAGIRAPMVTVVGAVAGLATQLAWFEPGPLAGRRIVVTRARSQASDLADRFRALGAHVVEAPVIAIRPRSDGLVTDERVASRWDWIVFTSANAVASFFAALRATGRDARSLHTTQIAVVGDATAAALGEHGLVADFVPSRATSDVLADELPRATGARILLPISSLAGDRLAMALRRRGAHVEQVDAYDTVAEPLDAERRRDVAEADAITFTSASTARNLREALGESAPALAAKLVSIGPQTSAAVREAFGRVDAEAAEPSLDALVAVTREALGC